MAKRGSKNTPDQPTDAELRAAIELIRRAHASQHQEIADKLPGGIHALILAKRPELVVEIGEDEVIKIEALHNYPKAQFQIMRAALYKAW